MNLYLVFIPVFGTEPLKTLGISQAIRAIKVSYCVNEVNLGPQLRMWVGCQENQPCDWRVGTFKQLCRNKSLICEI